jgi:hypothetical protein
MGIGVVLYFDKYLKTNNMEKGKIDNLVLQKFGAWRVVLSLLIVGSMFGERSSYALLT